MNETTSLITNDNESNEKNGPQTSDKNKIHSIRSIIKHGIIIKNEGSTARDHLANERTYLAWMRTSLSLIGASIALLKWDATEVVSAYLIGILGLIVLLSSTYRYFRVMQFLELGTFEPNVQSILFVVPITFVAFISAFVLYYFQSL